MKNLVQQDISTDNISLESNEGPKGTLTGEMNFSDEIEKILVKINLQEGKLDDQRRNVKEVDNTMKAVVLVLLIMVAGMMFDFFTQRRQENGSKNTQPIINNYYYSTGELRN